MKEIVGDDIEFPAQSLSSDSTECLMSIYHAQDSSPLPQHYLEKTKTLQITSFNDISKSSNVKNQNISPNFPVKLLNDALKEYRQPLNEPMSMNDEILLENLESGVIEVHFDSSLLDLTTSAEDIFNQRFGTLSREQFFKRGFKTLFFAELEMIFKKLNFAESQNEDESQLKTFDWKKLNQLFNSKMREKVKFFQNEFDKEVAAEAKKKSDDKDLREKKKAERAKKNAEKQEKKAEKARKKAEKLKNYTQPKKLQSCNAIRQKRRNKKSIKSAALVSSDNESDWEAQRVNKVTIPTREDVVTRNMQSKLNSILELEENSDTSQEQSEEDKENVQILPLSPSPPQLVNSNVKSRRKCAEVAIASNGKLLAPKKKTQKPKMLQIEL